MSENFVELFSLNPKIGDVFEDECGDLFQVADIDYGKRAVFGAWVRVTGTVYVFEDKDCYWRAAQGEDSKKFRRHSTKPESLNAQAKFAECEEFARKNARLCAFELLEFYESSVLPTGGKVRELQKRLSGVIPASQSLSVAESIIKKIALQITVMKGADHA